jgi:hypothetical protein
VGIFIMRAIAAALLLSAAAGAADAATYTLGGSGGNLGPSAVFTAAGGPSITITAGASGILNGGTPTLFQSAGGLGVNGSPDLNPGDIDGSPIFSSEFVTVTFGWAVNLLSFGLSGVDPNDNYDISVNGGVFSNGLVAMASNTVGQNYVTSFVLRASGTPFVDGIFGNDDFQLASIDVASVPLPAAGFLLIAGLGALGVAGARRRAV